VADRDFLELSWIPVGAGTTFQRLSLVLYEVIASRLARRPRATLVHAGLTGALQGRPFTIELMPAPAGPNGRGEVSGPVGVRWAGRFRLFRYQVCVLDAAALPDQQWAIVPALRLAEGPETIRRVLSLTRQVPAHTWGRRAPGHREMWTSDSCVSWILARAAIDLSSVAPPERCVAPGWSAGLLEERRARVEALLLPQGRP
jgi:hypothetical protein